MKQQQWLNNQVGWLVWYSIPDCRIPYKDLQEIAQESGLPEKYIPQPPKSRSAWEKATNLGRRGRKVDVSQERAEAVRKEHKSGVRVRILTRTISRSLPLKRHLVREVVIPMATTKDTQRQTVVLAVLSFDGQEAKAEIFPDLDGWVTQDELDDLVEEIHEEYLNLLEQADGERLRTGARMFFSQHFSVALRGTGGVYFIPLGRDPLGDDLRAFRSYVKALTPWNQNATLEPSCTYVDFYLGSAAAVEDVRESVLEHLRTELMGIHDQAQEVATRDDHWRDHAEEKVLAWYALTKESLAAYQEALEDNLDEINLILEMASHEVQKMVG